ncbi:hypothetical protein BU15DRAFT_72149 [Melanogaster broomeanus]|nr:hypothetical protein BU15DRAFT_72149 [Melanogaster broomeanus]
MRFSVLSIAIVVSALASSGLSAAIPASSSTATIPRPVAALWKNRIHQEVNPKARTVDSIAPPEATSLAGDRASSKSLIRNRWGQAAAQLESALYVHGGLSDPFNSYSYTSAPEISDLLLLDLTLSFNVSSPPWQLLSAQYSPALGWHTISAFNTTQLLLFGGQPGPNSQTVLTTLNDSAALLSAPSPTSPSFIIEPQTWAGEPMRRMRHSASSTGGKVYIIGGEKSDGSGNAFDDHYVFSPSNAEFGLLPSSINAPPDIYGHASLVLPDGRLVVLGGYCASCSALVAMNRAWFLDTTQTALSWQELSISDASLPNPRRDFAAVVLPNGCVLIHGGGDAQLEATYSDGWVLDTSQNPMVWQNVDALTQLGERKDHLAVQAGGYILFCFGYGASSPAEASLFVYDPSSSSMVSSYIAPPPGTTPAISFLPTPTQTGGSGTGSGSGGDTSGGEPSRPSNTSGVGSGSSGSPTGTTAIALGATFGILGLIAGGVATAYYFKRGRDHDGKAPGRFFALGGDSEVASGKDMGLGAVPVTRLADGHANESGGAWVGPGAILDILAHLGISKPVPRPFQPRKNMFADEDSRSFGWDGRLGTPRREGSEVTSAWSLRSMGAAVRGMMSRETSGSGAGGERDEWEKMDRFRTGDRESLIRQEELDHHSELPVGATRGKASSLWSYSDPFEDPQPEYDYDDLNLPAGVPEPDADYDRPISSRHAALDSYDSAPFRPLDVTLSLSMPLRALSPLKEVSHASLSEPSNSLPSLPESSQEQSSHGRSDNSIFSSQLGSLSQTSYSPTTAHPSYALPVASHPRYSIVNSVPPPSQPIRRSDSWWLRFSKTPLLDRRTSVASQKPLDFRDPRPAPALVPLEEPSKALLTLAGSQNAPTEHGRSVSSFHSGRTANTESAERLGGTYDVVQRIASDGSTSRRTPSEGSAETTEHGLLAINSSEPSDASISGKPLFLGQAPTASFQTLLSREAYEATPSPCSETITSPDPVPTFPSRGAVVSSRVKAYERRMSEELESQLRPLPRNTHTREEMPSRNRPTVQYGLAPRASLYIANPDSRHRS